MSAKNFFAELKRRNVYKVAIAYAIVGWLLIQIATQVFPFFEIPNWAVRLVVLAIVIGFPIALIFSWAFEITPEGIVRTEDVDLRKSTTHKTGRKLIWMTAVVAIVAAALFVGSKLNLFPSKSGTTMVAVSNKSIAVLPFVDMSQSKDQEYFCDGISEEILDALAKVDGLRVVARTSSFSFKGKNADVSEVANKLNVANVLEGSLRRNGNRIRITAQLIARDGFHLWSETYDRELQDVFAMQDEITRAIVDALKVKLAVASPARAQPNTEAYDLYLQGLFFSNKSSEEGLRKSIDLFQRALEKDPSLGRAWAGIARAWLWLADAYVKPLEGYAAAKAAAAKALALNEKDAEARCYLAESNRVLDWNIAAAQAEFQRALKDDPNSSAVHYFLASVLLAEGQWDQALKHAQESVKLDPLSAVASASASGIYLVAEKYDEVIAESRRTQLLDASYVYRDSTLAAAYTEKGMYAEAIAAYQKAEQTGGAPQSGLGITYAKMGQPGEARRILAELEELASKQYVAADGIAIIYAQLGDKEAALRWLERGYLEHSAELQTVLFAREFRPLHSDSRFVDLLKQIGIDPTKVLARDKAP